jgi:hypothetical protein
MRCELHGRYWGCVYALRLVVYIDLHQPRRLAARDIQHRLSSNDISNVLSTASC